MFKKWVKPLFIPLNLQGSKHSEKRQLQQHWVQQPSVHSKQARWWWWRWPDRNWVYLIWSEGNSSVLMLSSVLNTFPPLLLFDPKHNSGYLKTNWNYFIALFDVKFGFKILCQIQSSSICLPVDNPTKCIIFQINETLLISLRIYSLLVRFLLVKV